MKTYGRFPLTLSHGSGATLYDVHGNEYLDCVAGIATCTLGHADKRIADAVCDQVRKLGHVSNLYYIPQQGHLASWLVSHSPADKVFFCNSGAEANEAAIKLVRKYWHTGKGATMDPATGAMPVIITATGQPKYHANFGPLMPGFEYITYNCVDELRAAAHRIGENLAGIMMEAMQGEGGVRPGTSQFFSAAREICDASDALLVCDEVQVGVGRTGKLWGFENLDVTPDIFTVAKGLGGGVPIGAMLCKDSCNVFGPGDHASTFGGNPLASAAALAVTAALDNDCVIDNVIARGEQLRAGLESVAARYPSVIVGIRGWGLINGVELSPAVTAISVVKAAMASGLLLVPAGATVVRFVPPLVITRDEVWKAISMFEAAVATVLAA
jgi:acetylornithine/N-succinyldiaminopimelate aminotransferase